MPAEKLQFCNHADKNNFYTSLLSVFRVAFVCILIPVLLLGISMVLIAC